MTRQARHFRPIALVMLALLAACGASMAPEAECFAAATIAYRGAWRGAEKIRADLARGYALHPARITMARAVPCRVGGRKGTCLGNATERIEMPLAIDRADLQARLEALNARMDALRPAAQRAAAPCGYTGGSAPQD